MTRKSFHPLTPGPYLHNALGIPGSRDIGTLLWKWGPPVQYIDRTAHDQPGSFQEYNYGHLYQHNTTIAFHPYKLLGGYMLVWISSIFNCHDSTSVVPAILAQSVARFIHHNNIILFTCNCQQQNASQFLTDLELEAFDNVEYLTWYWVVNVASTWHVHVAL